jgi:hypothetical protein
MAEKAIASQDPFDVLPFEPFISCIQLALPMPEKGYTQTLLQFTMVSRKWRDTIVSTPTIWTSITVSRLDPDALAMIAISLHLSRNSMISLTFYHTMDQSWDLFCDSLAPHANRIRHITVVDADLPKKKGSSTSQGQLYFFALERVLHLLGNLPTIVSLDIGTSPYAAFPAYASSHRFILPRTVQYMRQWMFQRPALGDPQMSLSQLRELHTDEPLDVLAPILADFQQLERLVLSDPVEGSLNFPRPPSVRHPNSPTQSTRWPFRHSMSKLTILWYTQVFSGIFPGLLLKTAPNLLELVVRIAYTQTGILVDALKIMERIQILTLSIFPSEANDTVNPVQGKLPTVTSLRSLSITDLNVSGTEKGSAFNYDLQFQELFSKLVGIYPNVTDVRITLGQTRDPSLSAFYYLTRLARLRNLSIFGGYGPAGSLAPYELPSLEELSVEHGYNLHRLIAPNLLRLDCDRGFFPWLERFCRHSPLLRSITLTENFGAIPTDQIKFDPSSFSSLRDLHVRMWPEVKELSPTAPRFYLTSLPSLTKLSISGLGFSAVFTQATSLCLTLLYQPDICPKLKELVFEGVPEWDILFLMLEARNFGRDSAISSVEKITVSAVPYHLRSPLAFLLKGETAARPSNEEISFDAMSEIFFDRSMYVSQFVAYSEY